MVEREKTTLDHVKQFVAGGLAGGIAKTFVAPLERIKILYQISAVRPDSTFKFKGIFQSFSVIMKTQGITGFWAGHGVSLLRIMPYAAIQFSSHEFYKKNLLRKDEVWLSPARKLLAGAMAGMTAVSFTYPLDIIRTRLASQHETDPFAYRGLRHAITSMWETEGKQAFTRGLKPTLMGIVPYGAINFATYESLIQIFRKHFPEESQNYSVIVSLASGSIAGLAGQTVTYPLDVVRRRMQLEGFFDTVPKYNGVLSGLTSIAKNEGFWGLFRGVHLNYIRAVPSVSISFTTFNELKRWLDIPATKGSLAF